MRRDTLFLSFFLRTRLILTHVNCPLPQAAGRFLLVRSFTLSPTLSKLALGFFVALWAGRRHAARLPAAQTLKVCRRRATTTPSSSGCSTRCTATSAPASTLIGRLGRYSLGLFKLAQASVKRVGSVVLGRLVRLGRLCRGRRRSRRDWLKIAALQGDT